MKCLAFPGFKASLATKDFSYPACCAAAISASFSFLITFSFASSASAIFSKICFLSSEDNACEVKLGYENVKLGLFHIQRILSMIYHTLCVIKKRYLKPSGTFPGCNSHLACINVFQCGPLMCIFMEEGSNMLSLENVNDAFSFKTTERREKCDGSKEKPASKDEHPI